MDRMILDKICNQIYRKFPMLSNNRPKVSKQGEDRYLLVFSGSGQGPNGKSIQTNVRVVADSQGKIIKTSMSK